MTPPQFRAQPAPTLDGTSDTFKPFPAVYTKLIEVLNRLPASVKLYNGRLNSAAPVCKATWHNADFEKSKKQNENSSPVFTFINS
jgi:hypothetical protein